MKKFTMLLLALVLMLAACSSAPEVDVEATVAAAVEATRAAEPTNTPLPTAEPEPTEEPAPTPEPTEEPAPTEEPQPTPEPEAEPTDEPAQEAEPTEEPQAEQTEEEAAKTVRSVDAATGLTTYELQAENFSVQLPADWEVADLENLQLGAALSDVGSQNEGLTDLFGSDFFQNLVASGVRFYAVNTSDQELLTISPPTLNVVRQELPFDLTLDEYLQINLDQIAQFFDLQSEVETGMVMLGNTEAAIIQYDVNLNDPLGRPLELKNTQYLMIDGQVAYVVSLGAPRTVADATYEAFVESAETFRILSAE